MAVDEAQCPYCNVTQSYAVAKCTSCGEELPWAQWVKARQQPSAAMGAQQGQFAGRSGQALSDGIGLLPKGAAGKILLVVLGIAGCFFVMRSMSSNLKSLSGAANGNNVAVPAGAKDVEEKFRKANPVIGQEEQNKREEGQ